MAQSTTNMLMYSLLHSYVFHSYLGSEYDREGLFHFYDLNPRRCVLDSPHFCHQIKPTKPKQGSQDKIAASKRKFIFPPFFGGKAIFSVPVDDPFYGLIAKSSISSLNIPMHYPPLHPHIPQETIPFVFHWYPIMSHCIILPSRLSHYMIHSNILLLRQSGATPFTSSHLNTKSIIPTLYQTLD